MNFQNFRLKSQPANGSATISSVESFQSEVSGESTSTTDEIIHRSRIGPPYTNEKPPLLTNRTSARSHSAHTRPFIGQTGRLSRTANVCQNDMANRGTITKIRQQPINSGVNNDPNRVM